MSTTDAVPGPRKRRWRWRLLALLAVVALPVVLLAALPWVVSSPWAKAKIQAEANKILAPSGVSFDRVAVSWFRPTEIGSPTLLDAKGHPLVTAPSGTFSWSLWQILFARPPVGTMTLHGGAVEIGRSTEGKVDLIDTLKPLLKERPDHTIQVRIRDATFQFAQEGLADPFYAGHADIDMNLTRFPEPISWDFKLSRDKQPSGPGKMTIAGSLPRTEKGVDLARDAAIAVTGDRWPWRIAPTFGDLEGVQTSGVFSGSIDAKIVDGALTTAGDATIDDFRAGGPKLSGDEFRQERLAIGWKAQGRAGTYEIERFAFQAPAATLSAAGVFPPAADRPAKLQGRVDLAAIANQLRHTLRLQDDVAVERGVLELLAEATPRAAGEGAQPGQRIEVTAKLDGLAAKKGERSIAWNDPTTLDARVDRRADAITLEQLDVRTPFLAAIGKGNLDDGIDVKATFDLAVARERLRDWVDLGKFEAAGAGTLHALYTRKAGRYDFAADGRIKGLVLAGLPMVETVRRDELTSKVEVRGEASPSGLPKDWRFGSLTAHSAEDELELVTTSPVDRQTPSEVKAKGRTTVDFGGSKRIVEASGTVVAGDQVVDATGLRVSTAHFVGPGGDFMPDPPYVWRGSARYDVKKDELAMNRRDAEPEADEKPPAFSIDQVLAGGFRKQGSAWFQVNLSGDLDAIQDVMGMDRPTIAGVLAAEVDGRQAGDLWDLDAIVRGQKLERIEGDGKRRAIGDATLTLDSKLALADRRVDVARLALDTPFAKADGRGSVALAEGEAVVDMKGDLAPDWGRLTRELSTRIEPNASIKGRPHAWRLAGRAPLGDKAEEASTLEGEAGLQIDLVDVFGMRLEQTTLVARVVDGKLEIDPIDAMLNSGRLQLDPAVDKDKEGKRWLRLGKGSSLAGAVVNDEVSHRFLSYVAPVLDQSTRVEGKVSFDLQQARFSLDGDATKTRVEGDVQFDEVRFMPGPLVDQLIAVFNLERKAIFVLRDPVSIQILGRKIFQEGLILPVGEVAVIGIEGWIDFDKKIDMLATFAAVPPEKNIPVVSVLLQNARIQVPLTGTLDKPRIDGERIKERFKDMGESILETTLGVGAGIGDLFRRGVNRRAAPPPVEVVPPDEAVPPSPRNERTAPPPPKPGVESGPDAEVLFPGFRLPFSRTPEERQQQKEIRQQRRDDKRNERRMRQGLPPR